MTRADTVEGLRNIATDHIYPVVLTDSERATIDSAIALLDVPAPAPDERVGIVAAMVMLLHEVQGFAPLNPKALGDKAAEILTAVDAATGGSDG